uniref:Uncharacterized protein n=1 Tax=Meloidogyne hapla TaxID=6305 RepID=A0A1I8B0Z1_MELHA
MFFYLIFKNKIIFILLFSIFVCCLSKSEEIDDEILKALNKETIKNGEIEVKTGEDKLGDNKIRKWKKYLIKRKYPSNGGGHLKEEEKLINEGENSLLDAPPINEKSNKNLDNKENLKKIQNVLDWNEQRAPAICGDKEWHYFDG